MSDDWFDEVFRDRVRFGLRVKERLFERTSPYQKVLVFESEAFGRCLAIDDVFMTSERDEFLYHEMLVHPPLVALASPPRRVLVIGGGDGGTVREVLRHPSVETVVMVEIDEMVVEASKKYLTTIGTAWEDPRLDLRIGDGIAYVKETKDPPFDAVLLDGTDPIGPAKGLFNEDFYRGVARVMKPNGVFAAQTESPFVMPQLFVEIQKTLRKVFPRVAPYFGTIPIYASGYWSWTFASFEVEPLELDEARGKAIEEGARQYNRDVHRAAFAQPNFIRRLLA